MSDLSPKPDAVTEEPELKPGGADALADDPQDRGQPRDPATEDNPAVTDVVPDEVAEPDDKQQEPDGSEDAEAGGDGEPAAGQTAEDGSPEPPA